MAKKSNARAGKARRHTETNNSSVHYLAELRRKERREREIGKLIGRMRKLIERNEGELHELGAWLMVRTAERASGGPAAAGAGAHERSAPVLLERPEFDAPDPRD